MEQSQWPEWIVCFQQLHQTSLCVGDKELSLIEGDNWYGGYISLQNGSNMHYFWFKWLTDYLNRMHFDIDIDREYDD